MLRLEVIFCLLFVNSYRGSAHFLTCPEVTQDTASCESVESSLCEFNDWLGSMKEWKDTVEQVCSEGDLGAQWEELFSCPDPVTVECANKTATSCGNDPFNCTICYCQDGKYKDRQKYLHLWKKHQETYRKSLMLYKEKIKLCDQRTACTETDVVTTDTTQQLPTDNTTTTDTATIETTTVVSTTIEATIEGCRKPMCSVNFSVRKDNVIDLTHVFDENSAYWPTWPAGFRLVELVKGLVAGTTKYLYSANTFSQPEHLGTHMDAPVHFSEVGVGVDGVSLYSLIGPGYLINLKQNGEKFGRDGLVTIDHIRRWEEENTTPIRSGGIVLIYTGYGDVYDDRPDYFGTNITGADAVPHLHFPGLDPDAAQWLVDQRCIAAVGIDTPSMDFGQSAEFRSHQILAKNGIPIFENVANLYQLARERKGFKIIALPQKISGGTGAPLRIIAVTD